MKAIPHLKLKSFALIGLFLFSFSVHAATQTETLEYSSAENDLQTAKATVEAYENENWDKLRSYLRNDARIFGLGSFDSLDVEQTISYWKNGSKTAAPTLNDESWLTVSVSEGPRKGNWVYHWGNNTLKYTNGEEITFPYHVALKMEESQVKEAHFYYDNNKIIREMGYAISPPLEEEELNGIEEDGAEFEIPTEQ